MSAAYDNAVLADGPIIFWKLDETTGTTIVDSSGGGNDGTLENNFTLAEPPLSSLVGHSIRFNNAGTFNGGAYLDTPVQLDGLTEVSIEFWLHNVVNMSGTGGSIVQLAQGGSAPQTFQLAAYYMKDSTLGANTPRMRLYVRGSHVEFSNGGRPNPDDSVAVHFVLTWNSVSGRARMYRDGELVEELTGLQAGQDITADPAESRLSLARTQTSYNAWGANTQSLRATVDSVAIYPSELTPAQVKAHWDAVVEDITPTYVYLAPNDLAAPPPLPNIFGWTLPPSVTSNTPVEVSVGASNINAVEVDVFVHYASGITHAAMLNGVFQSGYITSSQTVGGGVRALSLRRDGGWAEAGFTVEVRARNASGTAVASQAYTVTDVVSLYPPHMDPFF